MRKKDSAAKKENGFPKLRSEKDAVEWLRSRHPEFFNDPDARDLSAVILFELQDQIEGMSPVRIAGLLAGVQTLMYRMGSAAIQSINGGHKMARRCVDNYRRELNPSRTTRKLK